MISIILLAATIRTARRRIDVSFEANESVLKWLIMVDMDTM